MAVFLELVGNVLGYILEEAQGAYDGGGIDGFATGLVVEADIAADYGHVQDTAGLGHAPYTPLQLVVDVGPLGVAEIEAVGDGERGCSDAGEVAA